MTPAKGCIVLAALALAGPAAAHHSYAMFERKEMQVEAVVKEFHWSNPHMVLEVLVTGADGKPVQWSLEGASPNALSRRGWSFKTVKPGDKLTVGVAPLKDGRPGGALMYIVQPDGSRLYGSPLFDLGAGTKAP